LQPMPENILETSLTWTDLERNIKTALKTDAKFGESKSVIDIGDGNGLTSRCGLIYCDWIGADVSEILPSRVVIKIPSAIPLRQLNESLPQGQRMFTGGEEIWQVMEGKMREIHRIEVLTYEFFDGFNGLTVPTKYYGTTFEKEGETEGQICLKFMENSRMMNFHEKHTVEQVRQVARALGKIQACSLKKVPAAPEFHRNFFEEFAKTVTLEGYCGMYKALAVLDRSQKTIELSAKINKLLPEYYGSSLPTTIHSQMGFRRVLVNGDLRTENVLIDVDTEDLAALIDWQVTHLGVGVEDLIRISLYALTAEDRRRSVSMLVAEMYDSLVENLDGAEPPYTLETLLVLYDLLFPHCAFYFAGPCIMTIMNKANDPKLSAEDKEKRREVEIAKLLGALEDALEYDAKNKESKLARRGEIITAP
ncbi:hypothetical protein PFISCL1PPCAC_22928, partial [Pristionchus fissidentatus]